MLRSEGNSRFQAKLVPLETFQVEPRRRIDIGTARDLHGPGSAQVAVLANAKEERRPEIESASGKTIDAIALKFAEMTHLRADKQVTRQPV